MKCSKKLSKIVEIASKWNVLNILLNPILAL